MDMKMLKNICKDISQEVDTVYFYFEKASLIIKSFCQEDSDKLEDFDRFIEMLKKDLKEYLHIEISDFDIWFTIGGIENDMYYEVDLEKYFGGVTWLR